MKTLPRLNVNRGAGRTSAWQEQLLLAIPSLLIAIDARGIITAWNNAAADAFGISADRALGRALDDCPIPWDSGCIQLGIDLCKFEKATVHIGDTPYTAISGQERFLTVSVNPICPHGGEDMGIVLTAIDITDRKLLESQLAQAHKLESIGQLSAGIAHEINTPIQYVGDNTRFIAEGFGEIKKLQALYDKLLAFARAGAIPPELFDEIDAIRDASDAEYLFDEIPTALQQCAEGIDRVASIVRAMKEFSHLDGKEKVSTDLNHMLENVIAISRHQWRFVAEVTTCFDDDLPLVPCLPTELSQAFLNMVINACHAIEDAKQEDEQKKGCITITTRHDKLAAEIWIADNGTGIPLAARPKIFDPFFTTKEMGRGMGQGLSLARTAILDGHGGSVAFETESGVGTTFIVRLPLCASGMESELAG